MTKKIISLTMLVILLACASVSTLAAQDLTKFVAPGKDESRPRTVKDTSDKEVKNAAATNPRPLNPADGITPSEEAAIQAQINGVYQNFYNSYRLGPGDIIGIYIDKHPEDSVEKVTVSPVGKIYFPLLGNLTVVGKTMPQLQEYVTTSVSEYIREPRVTLALLEAQSAKIGVLGDVKNPGVVVMTRPLRVLDAIAMTGGILDTGSQMVSILRQYEDGRVQMLTVDVKKILKGKAGPEENAYLRAGDTVIVHGNLFKKLGKISSVVGVTTLFTFLSRGGR